MGSADRPHTQPGLPPDRMFPLLLLVSVLVLQTQGLLTCLDCGNRPGLAGGDCMTPSSTKWKECPLDNWCSVTFSNGRPESKGCEPSSVHEQNGYSETEADSGKWCKTMAGNRKTCVCKWNKCNNDVSPALPGAWKNGGTQSVVSGVMTVVTLFTAWLV